MHLRVIEGGLSRPVENIFERPVVWNRMPRESAIGGRQRQLVIIQNAPYLTLAVDDGRAFLVGIRDVRPDRERTALQAWLDWARGEGLKIVDQRTGEH